MAVISLRLNRDEERMLSFLTDYFDEDRSTLIKKALIEKYEDIEDMQAIDRFEKAEAKGNVEFISADEILKKVKKSSNKSLQR
jgi:predicted transcriptional regulator